MTEYFGKYKGFVRDNKDPENRGRIRCFCPQVMGIEEDNENSWLGWAEPCHPWLGGLSTAYSGAPLTKSEQETDFGKEYYGVWIEFEAGDPDFPIWVGTFIIAPIETEDPAVGIVSSGGAALPGGGIIGSNLLEEGSSDGPLNPPQAIAGREVRLMAPKGVDIYIGVPGGGSLILGPHGASLQGIQLLLNGAPFLASVMGVMRRG